MDCNVGVAAVGAVAVDRGRHQWHAVVCGHGIVYGAGGQRGRKQFSGVADRRDYPATTPTVTTTTLPDGQVNALYSEVVCATGTTPLTWAISAGTLPTA